MKILDARLMLKTDPYPDIVIMLKAVIALSNASTVKELDLLGMAEPI